MVRNVIVSCLLLASNSDCLEQQSKSCSERICIEIDDIEGVKINKRVLNNYESDITKLSIDSILLIEGRRRPNSYIVLKNDVETVPDIGIRYPKTNLSLSTFKMGKELFIYSININFNSNKSPIKANLSILGQIITTETSFSSIYYNPTFEKYINYSMYPNKTTPNISFLHLDLPNCYIAFSFDNKCLTDVVIIL